RQARRDRILALEDVDVGAADGGRGDANERVVGTDIGDGFIGQLDAAGLDEYSGFHHGSHWVLLAWNRRGCGRVTRRRWLHDIGRPQPAYCARSESGGL